MKKIFSKFDNKNDIITTKETSNFVGKTFNINRHPYVVEEILAEG